MTDTATATAPAGVFHGDGLAGGVRRWRGIRYALSPAGEGRWRPSQSAPPASGPVEARAFGPAAPQGHTPAVKLPADTPTDEDCLTLNIWSPDAAGDRAAPVMVWLHGGAYIFGASSQAMYDGEALARAGAVVVTINYRIGALGFLDLTRVFPDDGFAANPALGDILLALRWVQDNIAAFGGDPRRVTVFGESAGGGLVTTLLTSPAAEGLFWRAIAESSPASSVYDADRAAGIADRVLTELGVTDVAGLRAATPSAIVAAQMAVFAAIPTAEPGTIAFAPVIDGDLVPEAPAAVLARGEGHPVPLLIGTNRDEASLFRMMKSPLLPVDDADIDRMIADLSHERPELEVPTRAEVHAAYEGVRHHAIGMGIARDIGFRMPTIWVAEGHSGLAPTWLYRFDHATPMLKLLRIGATHGSELAYVWGTLGANAHDITFRLGGRRDAERIGGRMRERWVAFAAGGSPDAADAEAWPPYDTAERATLVIESVDRVVPDLDQKLRESWGDEVLAFP
ncbi:para-nitrobenzyl esterase [Microbacterium sp. SLBN-154]|uniref:carboxylesterase/lipase family protein n=1 Tax=Microbacterium sp. SLBN-154 TaxID=2768458 RepID=UPI00114DCCFC|nr:carboxylesterase/lipase family protein [Microbacterium sp. SLBN-154]TQK20849.1 para-nitrobenzyl esterase [Microbacterium sp. SLBN-154]